MDASKRTKKAQVPVITLDDGRVKKEPAEPVPSQGEAKLREELEKTKKNLQKAVRLAGEHLQSKEILEGIIDKKRVKIEPIEDPEKAHLRRVLKKKDEQLRESRRRIAELEQNSLENGRGRDGASKRTESRVVQGDRRPAKPQQPDTTGEGGDMRDVAMVDQVDDSIDERLDEGVRSGENNLNEVTTGSIGGERVGRPRRSTVRARANESSDDSDGEEQIVKRTRSKSAKNNGKSPSQAVTQKGRSSPNGPKKRGVKKNAKEASQTQSAMKKTRKIRSKPTRFAKRNKTDLRCIECEFRTNSIPTFYAHLGAKHFTNPDLAGIALRCDCGTEVLSAGHSYKCEIANFTVIRKGDGPIRRFDDAKTTPKCVMCEKYPKTASGYAIHFAKIHKCSLIANGVYLKCGCSYEITSYRIGMGHKKECGERQFTVHRLDED